MAYNTKSIVTDKDGNPISQYYNPATDQYEPGEGSHGANKVLVENNDLSLIPILDKLSQLTGTVIDEETRKANEIVRISSENIREHNETNRTSNEDLRTFNEGNRTSAENIRDSREDVRVSNENTRIELYNLIESKLQQGELNGKGLQFNWDGTRLGVRLEGETFYEYVDLKGETGDIDNLTKQHIVEALGYLPPMEDTITTINNKTGAISKEDIVELGIPAQDTNTTYAEITTAEIDTGTASTLRTITGRRVKYILDKVTSLISAITKSDVGLGSVLNYGIATKAEAEAGTVNTRYMTPLRVREVIDKNKAIVESGSNANGSYIKFEDGTMITTIRHIGTPDGAEVYERSLPLPAPYRLANVRECAVSVGGILILDAQGAGVSRMSIVEYTAFVADATSATIRVVGAANPGPDRDMDINILIVGGGDNGYRF